VATVLRGNILTARDELRLFPDWTKKNWIAENRRLFGTEQSVNQTVKALHLSLNLRKFNSLSWIITENIVLQIPVMKCSNYLL